MVNSSGANKDFPVPFAPWFDKDGRPLPFAYEFFHAMWLRSGGPLAPSGPGTVGITTVNNTATTALDISSAALGLGLLSLTDDSPVVTNTPTSGQSDAAFLVFGDEASSSGSSTVIIAGAGLTSKLGTIDGSISTTGTLWAIENINAQTGTAYTVTDADQAKLITTSNTASVTITLPQAGAASSFLANWFVDLEDLNTGQAIITPTKSTIDGGSTLALRQNQGVRIVSNGTNYFTQRGMGLWNTTPVSNLGTSLAINSGTIDLQTIAAKELFGNGQTTAAIPSGITVGAGLTLSTGVNPTLASVTGGGIVNVSTYVTNGTTTWSKPICSTVIVITIGAGGQGGGGAGQPAGTVRQSGSGGGGGARSVDVFNAVDIASTVTLTVGKGGNANGAGGSTGAGNPGSSGTTSTFGPYTQAGGGGGGAAGTAGSSNTSGGGGGGTLGDGVAGTNVAVTGGKPGNLSSAAIGGQGAGSVLAGDGGNGEWGGGSGGGVNSAGGGGQKGGSSGHGGGGGGGGGGVTAATPGSQTAAAQGGTSDSYTVGGGGTIGATGGGLGGTGAAGSSANGGAGGGGGGANNAGTGGAGGPGGSPGGGGGGGGGGTSIGGAGGNGADGGIYVFAF